MLCQDIIQLIMSHDLSGIAYKKYCLISTDWRNCAMKAVPSADIVLCNQLQTLILLFPTKCWNWRALSKHRSIDWKFITGHKAPWDYYEVAKNPNIIYENVKAFPQLPDRIILDKGGLIHAFFHYNINVKLEDFNNYNQFPPYVSDSQKLSYYLCQCNIEKILVLPEGALEYDADYMTRIKLSKSRTITWEIIKANPQIKWDCIKMLKNPNITARIILDNPNMFRPYDSITKPDWQWNWTYPDHLKWAYFEYYLSAFCARRVITPEIVFSHPSIKWNYRGLSMNPNFTFEFMISRPDLPWVWSRASMNPSITFETILAHPEIEWGRRWIGRNPNITWKIVRDNPDFGWRWQTLSKYLGARQ